MAKNDIGRSPSLIFKMFILVTWLSSSFKSAVVYQISSKSDDFSLRYGDLTICSMAGVRSVELLNLEFMSRDLYRRVILLLCAKFQFHWNRTIGCWVMAKKKRFLKWRPSAILNLKNFYIWSCDRHRVPNQLLCTKCHWNRKIFHWDMAISRFSRWRRSAIYNFRDPIMFFLKNSCVCLLWWQKDRQTNEQTDRANA